MPDDNTGTDLNFARRIESIYSARGYDTDPKYSELSPVYLQHVQSMEAAYLRALRDSPDSLGEMRVLDFGCGNGHWMARMISWGILQENLCGVDVREDAVQAARRLLPACRIESNREGPIPFPDASFDLCFANLVFTSILEDRQRIRAAMELQRVTRPGGSIFVLDFKYNNPTNPNVRLVSRAQVRDLFGSCTVADWSTLVLAPPIAARVANHSRWFASALEALPFLRTHFLAVLHKANN